MRFGTRRGVLLTDDVARVCAPFGILRLGGGEPVVELVETARGSALPKSSRALVSTGSTDDVPWACEASWAAALGGG